MKNYVRSKALMVCVLVGLAIGLSAAPAYAVDRSMVRNAQMRLADLGYFSGLYDGKLGPMTRASIKNFQRHNKLPATGRLTSRTNEMLVSMDDAHKRMAELAPPKTINAAPMPPDIWHYVLSERIPVRNGDMRIEEENKGTLHRFTVKLNGNPFLLADDQPGAFQISQVFNLNGEDALIMTAYRGEASCTYVNYLVTVSADGQSARKHEFASCAPSSEVHEAFGALFVRFASTMNKDGYDNWDVWRYENANLVRL